MNICDGSTGSRATAGPTGTRRRAVIVALALLLLIIVLSSPADAQNRAHVGKSCSGGVDITTFTFVPSSSKPGGASTAHLAARNCLTVAQGAQLTMVGRFTGRHRSSCPVIDPLARHETFPPHGKVRSKTGYDIPASCHASGLRVTATFAASGGGRLARKTAFLPIA
jgi:hypothetical protein